MDLTARDIHEQQFHDAWRGYNQEEVDDFLDRVADTVARLARENLALKQRIHDLDRSVAASRTAEETLKTTLVNAQRAAEEAIATARAKAEQLIAEAERRSKKATEEARERIIAAERQQREKLSEAERAGSERRRELEGSIEKLRAYEGELKQRLKMFLDQQVRALETLGDPRRPATAAPLRVADQGPRPAEGPPAAAAAGASQRRPGPQERPTAAPDSDAARRGVRSLFRRDE